MIPKHFGDWHEKPFVYVVNPQAQELMDKLYSETLSRTYVNSSGYHIMLMGLKEPLVEYGSFHLTLTFEKAGSIEVEVQVEEAGAAEPTH